MKRRRQIFSPAEFAAGLVFLLCVLTAALVFRNSGSRRYSNAVSPYFLMQPDHVEEEAISDYAGVRRTYTFTMPTAESATTTGARLTVYLRHTIAQFSIDGTTLYNDMSEDSSRHIGRTPGNYWVSIPVRPAYAGKTLRVTLTPVYESVRSDEPVFLVIGRDTLITWMELPKDGLLLVLSLVAVAAGLFLMVMVLTMPLESRNKRRILYLGAVSVAAGMWKLCGLPVVPLMLDFLGAQKGLWYTGAASYLLMMVLSLRVLTVIRAEEDNRTGMICFYCSACFAVLFLVLQLAGILELHEVLIWYGIGAAVLHLISLLGRKPNRDELLWLLPFFLTLGVDLLIFYIKGSVHDAPVFLIWVILNLLIRGFGFVREAIQMERELVRKERELQDAKVKTMMNQIRPHFIYNTLVSIYVLCKEDPERASEVVSEFTNYLQANFTAIASTELTSFGEELRNTRAYVAVESVLYGDKLQVEYDTEFTAFRLPPLTLQPLVENAVKYGVGKGYSPGHIRILSRAVPGGAELTVEDNGPGYAPSPREDNEAHIGLASVRERLELMCSGTLSVGPRAGGGTTVTVFVPSGKERTPGLSPGSDALICKARMRTKKRV